MGLKEREARVMGRNREDQRAEKDDTSWQERARLRLAKRQKKEVPRKESMGGSGDPHKPRLRASRLAQYPGQARRTRAGQAQVTCTFLGSLPRLRHASAPAGSCCCFFFAITGRKELGTTFPRLSVMQLDVVSGRHIGDGSTKITR